MSQRDLPRLAILVSGRGSNLQAFIDACNAKTLDATITLVMTNNPGAKGLQRAAKAGIPTACINHRDFASREEFDQAMVDKIEQVGADVVVLAGFMRILSPVFIQAFYGRLFNIHPSLLPKYPGLNTHQRALDAGDDEAGVTVHFVTQELDGGPPVLQAKVAINAGDTAESLAQRVIALEHVIYVAAIRWYLQGALALTDGGATYEGKPIGATGIAFLRQHELTGTG